MFAVSTPVELVLSQVNRATADAVPATGGFASGHEVVSESDTSGPLELPASEAKYAAAKRASAERARLWLTRFVPPSITTKLAPSAAMMNAWIVTATTSSTI